MTNVPLRPRDKRRLAAARSITECAQKLVTERGLDGFTLEDLAEQAGVSRRTLFNYFPSKMDAVVGAKPEVSEGDIAVFVEGGPSGDLIEDLIVLIRDLVDAGGIASGQLRRTRAVLAVEPRLLAHAHHRLEQDCDRLASHILHRHGEEFGHARAALMARLMACALDTALTRVLGTDTGSPPSWPDAAAHTIREARSLFR